MARTHWDQEVLLERNSKLYRKYVNLIREKAHSFSETTGLDYDELFSLGESIFMWALEKGTWDGKRPFGTFLHQKLWTEMIRYSRDHHKHLGPDLGEDGKIPEMGTRLDPSDHVGFRDMLSGLSEEALHITQILLMGPCEALGILGTEPPKVIRGAIQKYLVRRGTSHERSWKVLRELKEEFSK